MLLGAWPTVHIQDGPTLSSVPLVKCHLATAPSGIPRHDKVQGGAVHHYLWNSHDSWRERIKLPSGEAGTACFLLHASTACLQSCSHNGNELSRQSMTAQANGRRVADLSQPLHTGCRHCLAFLLLKQCHSAESNLSMHAVGEQPSHSALRSRVRLTCYPPSLLARVSQSN